MHLGKLKNESFIKAYKSSLISCLSYSSCYIYVISENTDMPTERFRRTIYLKFEKM